MTHGWKRAKAVTPPMSSLQTKFHENADDMLVIPSANWDDRDMIESPHPFQFQMQLQAPESTIGMADDVVDLVNFDPLGNIRGGHATAIPLFSRELVGLAICMFFAGVLNFWVVNHTRMLVYQYLSEHHAAKKSYINTFVNWMPALSFFIGLIADTFPLLRSRRKSYAVVGALVAFLSCIAMVVVFSLMDPTSYTTAKMYFVLLPLVYVGLQIQWVALIAASVEFAQREVLHERGQLQTLLFVLYYLGILPAVFGTAATMAPSSGTSGLGSSDWSLGLSALISAVLTMIPVPFILHCWNEEERAEYTDSLWRRVRDVWHALTQTAVYNVFIALTIMNLFASNNNSNVNSAARITSGFSNADANWLMLTAYGPRLLAACIWHFALINTNWWTVGCGGFIFCGALKLSGFLMQINDFLRGKTSYVIMVSAAQIASGWLFMLQTIPATEVITPGQEASIIGLLLTCAQILNLGIGALWTMLQTTVNLDVTIAEMNADTKKMRKNTSIASAVLFGTGILCFLMIFFLPRQKLDAQQMRAFGGSHRLPRYVLLLGYATLFAYAMKDTITKLS